MRAIILERKGAFAAALREDGTVVRTGQPGEIGDEIELEAEILRLPVRRSRWMRGAVAAALALVILGSSYTYTSVYASAYVSLDVGESSVELSVNWLGRVISVSAVSEDGAELARSLDGTLHGKRVGDAVEQTVTRFREEGYLDAQDSVIIAGVTSSSEKRGETLTEALENAVNQSAEDIPVYTVDVTPEERGEARARDISGGRYVFERDRKPEARRTGETPAQGRTETPRETQREIPRETGIPVAGNAASPSPAPTGEPAAQADGAIPSSPVPDRLSETPLPEQSTSSDQSGKADQGNRRDTELPSSTAWPRQTGERAENTPAPWQTQSPSAATPSETPVNGGPDAAPAPQGGEQPSTEDESQSAPGGQPEADQNGEAGASGDQIGAGRDGSPGVPGVRPETEQAGPEQAQVNREGSAGQELPPNQGRDSTPIDGQRNEARPDGETRPSGGDGAETGEDRPVLRLQSSGEYAPRQDQRPQPAGAPDADWP